MTDQPRRSPNRKTTQPCSVTVFGVSILLASRILFWPIHASAGLFEEAVAENASLQDIQPGAPAQTYLLNGYIRSDVYVGPGGDRGAEIDETYAESALRLNVKKPPYGNGFGELRLKAAYDSGRVDTAADLREAYVNLYIGLLDLRLGKQIVAWGRADGVNPTDNLTPKDLGVRSPDEDDRRMANLGARIALHVNPMSIEAVWMPVWVSSRLPAFTLPPEVRLADADAPRPTLDKGLGAIRLQFVTRALDMSFSYLFGPNPLPGIALDAIREETIDLALTPYRHHVAGFDFSTMFGDWFGLRGEAAFRWPLSWDKLAHAPHPDAYYVLGVDSTFGELSIIVQYIGRYIFFWDRKQRVLGASEEAVLQYNRMLHQQLERIQHAASFRLAVSTAYDTVFFQTLGTFNATTREWMARGDVSYLITDAMEVTVGGEFFTGPEGTLFGELGGERSGGFAEMKVSF